MNIISIIAPVAMVAAALGLSGCAPVALGAGAAVAHSVIQERSTADALKDGEIKVAIAGSLLEHDASLFADVGVDVTEGRVVLTGKVPRREDKVAATELAWRVTGVRAVEDMIEVGGGTGARGYLEDVRISNAIRYHLLTDPNVSSVNYNVETVDQVVHLTGLARSPRELSRVIDHARTTRGVQRVVSHVLTIDDPRRFTCARP